MRRSVNPMFFLYRSEIPRFRYREGVIPRGFIRQMTLKAFSEKGRFIIESQGS